MRGIFLILATTFGIHSVAQAQKAPPVVGFLNSGAANQMAHLATSFKKGQEDEGFVEGKNVVIEYGWAEGNYQRLPSLAQSFVQRQVSLIAATGGPPAAVAARSSTNSIPIVFVTSDPVKLGLVKSFGSPGGNATGVSVFATELFEKRFDLAHRIAPGKTIGVLVNQTFSDTEWELAQAKGAAQRRKVETAVFRASTEEELVAEFRRAAIEEIGALLVSAEPYFTSRRALLVGLAAEKKIPAIFGWREFPVLGGLVGYGTDIGDIYRQAGVYAGRILKGAKPEDLPVQQPRKFELVINLKTAHAQGVAIPPDILAIADEIIE